MKKIKCIFGVTLLLLITITSVAWAGSYMDATVKIYNYDYGITETKYNVGTKAVGGSVATDSVSRNCDDEHYQYRHYGTCYQSPYQMQVVDEYTFIANQIYE